MVKQAILIILLTVAAVFFKAQLSHVLDALISLHNTIAASLTKIFASDDDGLLVQNIIALLLIPLVLGGLVGLVFWFVKHEMMPHTMLVIWFVWLVLVTTMIAQNNMQKMVDASAASNPNAPNATNTQNVPAAPVNSTGAPVADTDGAAQ